MQPSPRLPALAAATLAVALVAPAAHAQFTLTLLQNNDAESAVLPINRDADPGPGSNLQPYAGAARFVSTLNRERATAVNPLVVTAGDNIIPGPQFRASGITGAPGVGTSYDARLFNRIGYDALSLGNHDFDLGPDVLATVIEQTNSSIPFLAANLDFSAEPRLQALVNQGRIAPSTVVNYGSERVGVIGVVTEELPRISSPRNVVTNPVRPAIEQQVAALQGQGVNKIVLLTQLQNINNDLSLATQVNGIDLIVSGGGQETQLDDPSQAIPGDRRTGSLVYPEFRTAPNGDPVAVFTTNGFYRYVGRVDAQFDAQGRLLTSQTDGRPFRVSGNPSDPEAVAPDAETLSQVEQPVRQFVQGLADNIIARTEVPLIARTSQVRTRETNAGNLVADALLDRARELAPGFGVDLPQIAIQNGGGIRNDLLLGPTAQPGSPADVSELDTDTLLPFSNLLAVIEDVPVSTIRAALEAGVGSVPGSQGRFAQIAGLRFTYDPQRPGSRFTNAGEPISVGNRILDLFLTDGTQLIDDGMILDPALTLDVATIDFLARGGDSLFPSGLSFEVLGTTYQQALFDYLTTDLRGIVQASQYTDVGLDDFRTFEPGRRIDAVPEPAALATVAGVGLLALRRRRR